MLCKGAPGELSYLSLEFLPYLRIFGHTLKIKGGIKTISQVSDRGGGVRGRSREVWCGSDSELWWKGRAGRRRKKKGRKEK